MFNVDILIFFSWQHRKSFSFHPVLVLLFCIKTELLNLRCMLWAQEMQYMFVVFTCIISTMEAKVKCTVGKEIKCKWVAEELLEVWLRFVCTAPGALTCATCWSDMVWATSIARSHWASTLAIEDSPSMIKFCKRFVWFKVSSEMTFHTSDYYDHYTLPCMDVKCGPYSERRTWIYNVWKQSARENIVT